MDTRVRSLLVLVPVLLLGGCRVSQDTAPLTIGALSCAPVGDQIAFVTCDRGWRTGKAWLVGHGDGPAKARLLLTGTKCGVGVLAWRHDGGALAIEGGPAQADGLWLIPVGVPAEALHLVSAEDLNGPDWSPDDKRLVWVDSGEGRGSRLAVMRTADRKLRYVAPSLEPVFPQWSPTGRWISFYGVPLHGESKRGSVYVVSPDGSNEKRLDFQSAGFAWVGPEELLHCLNKRRRNGSGEFVTWKTEVWKTNVRTGEESRLLSTTRLPQSVWVGQIPLAVSPDRRQLLLMGGRWPSEGGDIYSINLDRGDVHQLTTGRAASCPCWSGDGQTIAFVRAQTSIWIMRSDGSDKRQLIDLRDLPL